MRYTDATSMKQAMSLVGGKMVEAALGGASPFFSIFNFAKKGLTRAQRRKLARRRYRMFVDNIIMHHKRLHDRNREIVVSNAKAIALHKSKPKELTRPSSSMSPRREDTKWRDRFSSRQNILEARSQIESRKIRAKSRWNSIAGGMSGDSRQIMAS